MKKLIALLMALVMTMSLATVAWGAETYTVDPTNGTNSGTSWTTIEAALNAASDGDTIKLLDHVTANATIFINKNITLDGNGKTLTSTAAPNSLNDSDRGDTTKSAIYTTGCTIKNLTINGGWKGILILDTATQDTLLENVHIENSARGLCFTKNGDSISNKNLTVKNSTLAGWNSVATTGTVTFDTVIFNANGSTRTPCGNGLNNQVDTTLTNCTFAANTVITNEDLPDGEVITINGGTYACDFDDKGTGYGTFSITGGTFTVKPDESYFADGLVPVLSNGVYVTQEAPDNSVNKGHDGIDTEDWKVVDLTTGTAYDIAEDAEVKKIVYKDIKKTVNGKTTTHYGVTLYGPLTFDGAGAAANGGYAMVVAKDSANMQLETDAGKIIFARFLTADEYAEYSALEAQYAYTTLVASKFVEDAGAPYECEDPNMDYYVVGDDYYAAATSNADNTLVRYKNEFVLVGAKLEAEPLVPHTFMLAPGECKWSMTNNELSSVKCTCGDTFKVVQDIKGLKAGSYYALGDGNYVVLKATSSGKLPSGTTTSTTTVTSAETFDAGIAMYVGMSVMAATGSAVVIGKKKD